MSLVAYTFNQSQTVYLDFAQLPRPKNVMLNNIPIVPAARVQVIVEAPERCQSFSKTQQKPKVCIMNSAQNNRMMLVDST